ncbi:MAG: TonB-dependent receptor [Bermanella sp.]
MKTPLLLSSIALSATSLMALAASPTAVNGQITDAAQPTEVNGAIIDAAQKSNAAQLDTISVTADFRQLDVMEIPAAVTVINKQQINTSNASHLENILSMAPNVNFASGASRARFFQIRGIGERSQFKDPVNASVGLTIDGIDMTGLGGAATLFDIEQVEILRGPQGTAFGANALAGAINIVSTQPTTERNGYIKSRTGNYSTTETGAAISSAITDSVLTRFAYNHLQSNGYTENVYQNRDNTNKFDEQVVKSITTFDINDTNDVAFTLLNANINNGYDAFSLTNNRNTYSNDQGYDKQSTTASSVKWINSSAENFLIETTVSAVNTASTYSYDEDWSYGVYDSNGNCISECIINSDPFNYVYSTFDEYKRETNKGNIDVRLLSNQKSRLFADSTDWIFGIYSQNKYEKLNRAYTYDFEDPSTTGLIASNTTPYSNRLENHSYAAYFQLTSHLSTNTQITYGIRAEEWESDFTDFTNLKLDNKETLFGGQISLESLVHANHLAYFSLARGYKAGGFNSDPDVSETNRTYKTETNNTAELGLKSSLNSDSLNTRLAIFYTQRQDQQVKSSYIIPATDPNEAPDFQDYIANAAKGDNYGLEAELNWRIAPKVQWLAALGLLQTEFTDYEYETTDGTFSKTGRDQAHAPNWTLNTSVITNITQYLSMTLSAEGKDKFYFSDSHDEQSKSYGLIHAQIKYQKDNLELALTGRNLTDKDYAIRGFGGFGNNPNNQWSDTQHTQLGEPRLISVSAKYNF